MDDETAIRKTLERYSAAIEAKDATAVIRCYTAYVVAYDLAPPLEIEPQEVLNPSNLQEWFDTWDGPIKSEPRKLTIRIGSDRRGHDKVH